MHELLTTVKRLKQPLLKIKGQLQESTYEAALARLQAHLEQTPSPDENIAVIGSARSANEDNYLLAKLSRSVFKTNNLAIASESGHRNTLNVLQNSTGLAGALGSMAEIGQAEYILVVGSDITKMNPIMGANIHAATISGSHLTTLCSTRTQIAKLSRVHLQQKPGQKKLVLEALAKIIVDEKLYDSRFMMEKTQGLAEFQENLKSLTPEKIATSSGIAFETLKNEARRLMQAESVMFFFSSGISGLDEATITAIVNLFLLTGKIGQPGSGIIPAVGIANLQGSYDMGFAHDLSVGFCPLKDSNCLPGKAPFSMLADPKSQLTTLIVVDHDEGIIRFPDRIKKLPLTVFIGAFHHPFADLADIVFPVAAYHEYDGTYTAADRRVQISKKKTEPPKGVIAAWQLYQSIANQCGAAWNYSSSAAIFEEIAREAPNYSGLSHSILEKGFGIQWPCDKAHPAGSPRFTWEEQTPKLKFLPIPKMEPVELPNAQYPIALMIGKAQHFWHQNNLMRNTFIPRREFDATLLLYPEGYIEICAEDAKKLGVRDKWKVKVISPAGQMLIAVKISPDVQPDTAYIPYFIRNMISEFLIKQDIQWIQGEEAVLPVRLEKV